MPMYTLGHDFVPPPVHAGGLRYHGDAPSLCALVKEGVVEARAIPQTAAFDAAVRFAQAEGIIPAPEPAHALRVVFDEAEAAKEAGEERVILVNLCGHGHFDMAAYDAYHAGRARPTSSSPRPTWRRRWSAFPRLRRSPERVSGAIVSAPGEVTERLKVRDWKSRGRVKPPRGFESHPLR